MFFNRVAIPSDFGGEDPIGSNYVEFDAQSPTMPLKLKRSIVSRDDLGGWNAGRVQPLSKHGRKDGVLERDRLAFISIPTDIKAGYVVESLFQLFHPRRLIMCGFPWLLR